MLGAPWQQPLIPLIPSARSAASQVPAACPCPQLRAAPSPAPSGSQAVAPVATLALLAQPHAAAPSHSTSQGDLWTWWPEPGGAGGCHCGNTALAQAYVHPTAGKQHPAQQRGARIHVHVAVWRGGHRGDPGQSAGDQEPLSPAEAVVQSQRPCVLLLGGGSCFTSAPSMGPHRAGLSVGLCWGWC